MRTYEISYSDRETIPDILERRAHELGLTSEQLIRRFIVDGIQKVLAVEGVEGACDLGESFEDFLVKNGVLKPR